MDIDRFNREQAELMKNLSLDGREVFTKHELQPGEFICPRCKEYILDENRRYHPCKPEGERFALPTLYIPNSGKLTNNADPAYRKHAGSRSLLKRMKARARLVALGLNNLPPAFAERLP